MSFLENICPLTDSKTDILKDLSDINNTKSKSILSSIEIIIGNLEDNSCDTRGLAEKQANKLKQIKLLYEKYKKEKYTDLTNSRLQKVFDVDGIDINRLDELDSYAEKIINLENNKLKDTYFSEDTFRDNIERNINFVWEYIHWTYNETPEMEEFLNLFTIEYINLIRKEKKNIKINNASKLILTKKELKIIIVKVQKRIKSKKIDFEIEFNLIWSEEKIKIKDFIEKYEKEKTEAEKRAKDEKSRLEKLKKKREKYEKESPDFNYLEEINKSWMDEYNKKLWLRLIKDILKIDITPEKEKNLLNNLKVFISFIIDIESDWKNINNKKSSAQSYFQFLTWNEWISRKNWEFNSLESALRRSYFYYTNDLSVSFEKLDDKKGAPKWIVDSFNSEKYNLRKMSVKNQTTMFLIDMFYKNWTNKYLTNMLLNWNSSSMERLYKDFHHTAPDKATSKRLNEKLAKYKNKLIKKSNKKS